MSNRQVHTHTQRRSNPSGMHGKTHIRKHIHTRRRSELGNWDKGERFKVGREKGKEWLGSGSGGWKDFNERFHIDEGKLLSSWHSKQMKAHNKYILVLGGNRIQTDCFELTKETFWSYSVYRGKKVVKDGKMSERDKEISREGERKRYCGSTR